MAKSKRELKPKSAGKNPQAKKKKTYKASDNNREDDDEEGDGDDGSKEMKNPEEGPIRNKPW